MKSAITHWNSKYNLPLDEIPWEIQTPPHDLVTLLTEHLMLEGGHALDVACGTGNYSQYLAFRGFHVTAIDFSTRALAIANARHSIKAGAIKYIEGDATKLASLLPVSQHFDLILDYSFSHHLPPDVFADYARQYAPILRENGKLLVVCYSPSDPYGQGRESVRGAFGNEMFYRTRAYIEAAYKPLKIISYRETTLGKKNHHRGHSFVFGH